MKSLYIKPEIKKNDTTAMATAINEACIGWLHENCCLMRETFLVREMRIFSLLGGILLRFFPIFWPNGLQSKKGQDAA